MFPAAISNPASLSKDANVFPSSTKLQDPRGLNLVASTISPQQQIEKTKKKRSLPGNPDPDAEVIALSPKTLLATNRYVCEICNKGFQRDQNLQLHRRGHNLPWKLKQRDHLIQKRKKAYVCPEPSCVHHHPSRALGDLTGIKKHYCRKHGEKKWKCQRCSKIYAVQSDWKAHSKVCGTREYRCHCGTLFSRKDSFITHRAFCDVLAQESARVSANQLAMITNPSPQPLHLNPQNNPSLLFPFSSNPNPNSNPSPSTQIPFQVKGDCSHRTHIPPLIFQETPYPTSAYLSATALLQKAATFGAAAAQKAEPAGHMTQAIRQIGTAGPMGSVSWQKSDCLTKDFLSLTGDGNGVNLRMNINMLTPTTGLEFQQPYEHHHLLLKRQGSVFPDQPALSETWLNY